MNRSQRILFLLGTALLLFAIPARFASAQTACYAAWNAATAYSTGQTASYSNVNYTANWWTQGNNPSTNNGVTGSGEPWTSNGACSSGASCSASPSAPGGLAASGTTSTGTTLAWSGVAPPANCSISSYTILQNGAAIGTATGTSFSVTGLTASTTYTFTVEATDSFGSSAASTPPVSVTTLAAPTCAAAPSAPAGLSSSGITSSGATISWGAVTPPANCTISSYTVLKNGASVGTATGTSLAVSGLSASTTYSFTVEATDAKGTSSASSPLSVTTLASGGSGCAAAWNAATAYTQGQEASVSGINYVANWWTQGNNPTTNSGPSGSGEPWTSVGACSSCAQVPAVPTGLAASGTTSTTTSLNWGAVTPPASCTISSYSVYENGSSVGTASSNAFTVAGLTPSTTYTFAVAATDSDGTSAKSTPPVSVTTPAAPVCTAISSAPTGLAATGTSNTGTSLSWTAVTPPANCTISSYTILKNGASIGTATGTTFAVTGLSATTTYTFTVEATDGKGTSTASSPLNVTTTNTPANVFMGGWFEEWGTYYANSNVADLQNSGVVNSLTHVIYAFAKPVINSNGVGASCQLADTYADYQKTVPLLTGAPALPTGLAGNLGGLWQLKQLHPNLKLWISVGGWNPPTYNQAFQAASSSAANQQAFVNSCMSMFIQGNLASGLTVPNLFDGIEIDWEFPNASDTANFTALMAQFRTQMTALTQTTGKTYQLAADLSAGKSTPGAGVDSGNDGGYDTIDIAGLSAQVDYMNVDGYNYSGDFSSATNDASPLYDEPADPLYNTCATEGSNYIDCTVQYYLAHGATPSKYTMGFPLYGVGWTGGLTSANSGMYQTGTGEKDGAGAMTTNGTIPVALTSGTGLCSSGENQGSPAPGCDPLLTDGMATYGTIANLLSQNPGFAVSFDATRCATRVFDPATTGTFADWAISYDDANSVACKASYIQAHGLGGGYVWALKDDTTSGTLTKAIGAALGVNP